MANNCTAQDEHNLNVNVNRHDDDARAVVWRQWILTYLVKCGDVSPAEARSMLSIGFTSSASGVFPHSYSSVLVSCNCSRFSATNLTMWNFRIVVA